MTKKIQKIITQIQKEILEVADPKYQKVLHQYMKEQVGVRGLKSKQIDGIFKVNWNQNKDTLKFEEQVKLGLLLLKDPHLEDKCVGMRVLNAIHKNLQNQHIDQIQNLILQGYAKEWGTIDSLCSRLLGPWALLSKQNTIHIANWRFQKDNVWVRRASCVSFVNRVKHGDEKPNFKGFSDLMFEVCQETVRYNERFNLLASGWLIRGLTISHRERAIKFIEDNYDYYSRESLRYAILKVGKKERKRLMEFGQNKIQQEENEENYSIYSEDEEDQEEEQQVLEIRKPKKSNRKKQKKEN